MTADHARRPARESALEGMLADAAADRPGRAAREAAAARVWRAWRAVRWTIAWVLAAAGLGAAVAAIVGLLLASRDDVGFAIQALTFVVAPLLSVVALGLAYTTTRQVLRVGWLPAALVAAAVAAGGCAHVAWYRQLDDSDGGSVVSAVWLACAALSVALFVAASIAIVVPALRGAGRSRAASTALSALIGLGSAALVLGLLFFPLGSMLLAVATIVGVAVIQAADRSALAR